MEGDAHSMNRQLEFRVHLLDNKGKFGLLFIRNTLMSAPENVFL